MEETGKTSDNFHGRREGGSGFGRICFRFLLIAGAAASITGLFQSISECGYARKEYDYIQPWGEKKNGDVKQTDQIIRDFSESFQQRLKLQNPDYAGWVLIPETRIDYPVVKSHGSDYYLSHTFLGEENGAGCIFTDQEDSVFSYDNLILFGHNRRDGSMFGDLKKYKSREFFQTHPVVWIHMENQWFEGRIFSCRLISHKEESVYQIRFANGKDKREYLEAAAADSLYFTGVTASVEDSIVTLSTCYGEDKRMIVQAVLLCYTEL